MTDPRSIGDVERDWREQGEETFDYVKGYDRMWQHQHDLTKALVRTIAERDALQDRLDAISAIVAAP